MYTIKGHENCKKCRGFGFTRDELFGCITCRENNNPMEEDKIKEILDEYVFTSTDWEVGAESSITEAMKEYGQYMYEKGLKERHFKVSKNFVEFLQDENDEFAKQLLNDVRNKAIKDAIDLIEKATKDFKASPLTN